MRSRGRGKLACKMPTCFCPEELGGAGYFEPVGDGLSDWCPTHEHFPVAKKDGGHRTVDNSVLAHRLCNRIDHSIRVGRSHTRDLERIKKAREDAIARSDTRRWSLLTRRLTRRPSRRDEKPGRADPADVGG